MKYPTVIVLILTLVGICTLDAFVSSSNKSTRLVTQVKTSAGQTEMAWQELETAQPELVKRYHDASLRQANAEIDLKRNAGHGKILGIISFSSLVLALGITLVSTIFYIDRKKVRGLSESDIDILSA